MSEIKKYTFYLYSNSEYDILDDTVDIDVELMDRQSFTAYLRPETRELFDSEEGIYALANYCLWDEEIDEDEFRALEEGESVEDDHDDMIGFWEKDAENNETYCHVYDYFNRHDINEDYVEFAGSGSTQYGEWST